MSSCRNCKTELLPDGRFCLQCGTSVRASGILAQAVATTFLDEGDKLELFGERRFVTVLFTDISGFTAMSERLDPEVESGPQPGLTPFEAAELGLEGTESIEIPDFGRYLDQPQAASGSALLASLNRPLAVAWRRTAGGQELYIYDSYNSAIRRAATGAAGDFRNAAVTTIVGAPASYTHAAGYQVTIGLAGQAALESPAAAARLDLARYGAADLSDRQVVNGGLAVDGDLGRLFVTDTNNLAIRMIDLASDMVYTVAAHDPRVVEGDSRRALLSNDLGAIAVLRDHSVVFADTGNHVIRRLHLQFGFD